MVTGGVFMVLKSEALLVRCQAWAHGSVPGGSTAVLGTQPHWDTSHLVSQKPWEPLGSRETAGYRGSHKPFPTSGPRKSSPNLFQSPAFAQFLKVLLSLDNSIPWLHESTLNKSSQWVLFLLCLANFTPGLVTQKPLLTSCRKEKRLGHYLGIWKGKLPTAKEQKTNYYCSKLSYSLYIFT